MLLFLLVFNSVELQDMGFSRQTSGYELGFSKNYMSGSIQFVSDGADLRYKRRKVSTTPFNKTVEHVLRMGHVAFSIGMSLAAHF